MNILVGENEAGKSTILDAIKTVLNQQYRNADKSILRDLFNTQMVAAFKAEPSVRTLPRIYIEVELALDPQQKNASYFYGEIYGQRKQQVEKFGIRFECKYDEELGTGMEQSIQEGKIPYEYYTLTWTTFANRPYQMIKRPLNFLAIDTTSSASATSFNYFNRTLFMSRYDDATKAKAKNEFRDMADNRKKTSMSQVLADIKPYITKKFMAAPCIKEQDIQAICQILLPRYENVQLIQGLTNNKPDFRIQVKGLFGTEEKRFEVVCGNKKSPATKKKSDLGWIDRLEEIDAALDDF